MDDVGAMIELVASLVDVAVASLELSLPGLIALEDAEVDGERLGVRP